MSPSGPPRPLIDLRGRRPDPPDALAVLDRKPLDLAASPGVLLGAPGRFNLLPTFAAPHYSVLLPSCDEGSAQRSLDVLGEMRRNPFYVGRQA